MHTPSGPPVAAPGAYTYPRTPSHRTYSQPKRPRIDDEAYAYASEHASPVRNGGIEVFQRAWRAKRSRSTVGRSEAGASSSQPRRAARHQPATSGALDARQARAIRPQQPHVTKRRPQHHFSGQQAGGRVGFSWQHACGRSNGPPEGDLAIKKAGYGLPQNRTAGGRGAEILGLLIYTYETIRKVCRMFCDLGSETPLKKKGWRNAVPRATGYSGAYGTAGGWAGRGP